MSDNSNERYYFRKGNMYRDGKVIPLQDAVDALNTPIVSSDETCRHDKLLSECCVFCERQPATSSDSELVKGQVVEVVFGAGELTVDAGHYGDRPAVFIERARQVGVVGEFVPKDQQGDLSSVTDNALVLVFPTDEQATSVSNALVDLPSTDSELNKKAEEAISTCVAITNITDSPHIHEMAEHVASLISDISSTDSVSNQSDFSVFPKDDGSYAVVQAEQDRVAISRECAEYLFAQMDKGQTVYVHHDMACKVLGELKAALDPQ